MEKMSSPFSIVLMNTTKAWGGGEKWHFETALNLQLRQIPVCVLCAPGSELEKRCQQQGIQTFAVKIGNWSYLNILKIFRLSNWLREHQARILIVNSSPDFKAGGIAARLARLEQIIYRRGSAIPLKNHLVNRQLFQYAISGVLANSQETKRTINQNYPFIAEDAIEVIYNGLDIESLQENQSEPLFHHPENCLVIGNAGRLVEQKNQKDLIEMARVLVEKNISFKLILAGTGPLESNLKELVKQYRLQDSVVFLGFVEDMPAFYKSLDIFVLSSKWEGFGYVLAEAMFYKVPVIAYPLSSNSELVIHDKTGLLTLGTKPQELADSCEMLANNTSLRLKMGLQGHERVLTTFNQKINFEAFLRYLGLAR